MRKNKKFALPPPVSALLVYTAVVLLTIFCLKHVTLLFAPVFFSFVIAYLFSPLVTYLENKGLKRGSASAMVMVSLVFLGLFVLVSLFPYVVAQVKQAGDKIPQILAKFSEKVNVVSKYISLHFSEYVGNIDLMGKIEELLSSQLSNLSTLMVTAFSSIYSLFVVVLLLVFVPLISYYFIKDSKKIQRFLFSLVPARLKDRAIIRTEKMDLILSSFIRGQAIVVIILAVLYSVGLSLIGLPFSILIGVMAGIGDIIPYMGTIVGLIVSLIVGLAYFQPIEKVLLVLLIFAIVKGSENWSFYPKIVGREVGLHFVWVLVAIVVFGHTFGFWGLLIAIPAAAGFKMYLHEMFAHYKQSAFYNRKT